MMEGEMFGLSDCSDQSDDEDGSTTWADGEQLGPVAEDMKAGAVFSNALEAPRGQALSTSPQDSMGCFPTTRGLLRLQTLLTVSDNSVRAVTNGEHVKVGSFWQDTKVVVTFLRRFG